MRDHEPLIEPFERRKMPVGCSARTPFSIERAQIAPDLLMRRSIKRRIRLRTPMRKAHQIVSVGFHGVRGMIERSQVVEVFVDQGARR